jgi:transposase
MTKVREIDHDTRVAIATMRDLGHPIQEVAKKYEVSKGAVTKIFQKFQKSGFVANRPRSGRPRKTNARMDRIITRIVYSGAAETATEVSNILETCHQTTLNPQTVRNRLSENLLVARVKPKKPLWTEKQKAARLGWAKDHINWTEDQWDEVLWTDESKFKLFKSDGRQWVWVRKGTKRRQVPSKPTVKYGGGGVMVWGAFSSRGTGSLCKIDGIMDSAYYQDILEDNLPDCVQDLFGSKKWILQQDNDRKHTSKSTSTFLDNLGYNRLAWPSQSPDLNPIEHLWDELGRRVKKNHRATNENQLWEVLQEEWKNIPEEVCRKLVRSMPNRCAQVIESHGGATDF